MQRKTIMASLLTMTLCGPVMSAFAVDGDTDRAHPKEFVTDSAITAKIKAKLAAEHITSLGRIHVDTDKDGVVWLSGTARTQDDINQAIAIARGTEHVRAVQSDITLRADD